jgi:ABC-type nitrate/sulfonate/bicarbonate transport system ATPase subunit
MVGKRVVIALVAGLKGKAGGCVRGDGSEIQLSSCGIGFCLVKTAALPWKRVASLKVLVHFCGGIAM